MSAQLEIQATLEGQPVQLPDDLFIPPEAMKVFLETFEGPLDLLLYLIRRHNLDILNINVAAITHQYIGYLDLMQELELELAAEYLVMAALLAEIKSRSLLPVNTEGEEEDEEDPRQRLIQRLLEYERFKNAAQELDALPREERDVFIGQAGLPKLTGEKPEPQVEMQELLLAFAQVLRRADAQTSHQITSEPLSTRERMSQILLQLENTSSYVEFNQIFKPEEGKAGLVVNFIALLELVKEQLVELVQTKIFAPIHFKLKATA